jgi:thioredoxin 2
LDISAPPFAIDDAGLIKLVRTAPVPVLVDFWAPWCGPCRAVAPHLIQLAKRKAGRLLVAKIDTMKHPNTAAAMRIQSIPTFCVWRGGNVVAQHAGALLGLQLDEFVDPHLT